MKKSASVSRINHSDFQSKTCQSNIKVVVRFRPNTPGEEELIENKIGYNITTRLDKETHTIYLKEK